MKRVLDLALTSFRPYAQRHGYDLVIGAGESAGRPPAWAKVPLLQRLLEGYDEVLWLDSDMYIVDPSVDVATAIPPSAFQAFARQRERNGVLAPNSGLWYIRNRPEGHRFLDLVWNSDAYAEGMWENSAVLDLLGYTTVQPVVETGASEWSGGTHYLEEEWNTPSYGTGWPPGTKIVHFLAMAHARRMRAMRLARVMAAREQGRGGPAVVVELAARRLELSIYVRGRGRADKRAYLDGRFS